MSASGSWMTGGAALLVFLVACTGDGKGGSSGEAGGTAECGDGECSGGESCSSCSKDCSDCPVQQQCGDGQCSGSESCSSCSKDCSDCPVQQQCGDGQCSGSESYVTCGKDCGRAAKCGEVECGPFEECDAELTACVNRMTAIPGGTFWMGCNDEADECDSDEELPYHQVESQEFKIDTTEVTSHAYAAFLNDHGNRCGIWEHDCYGLDRSIRQDVEEGVTGDIPIWFEDGAWRPYGPEWKLRPVHGVSWWGAEAYCEWAGKRLCGEAEWEKASRGGCEIYDDCEKESRTHPWGNAGATCDLAMLYECPTVDKQGYMEVGSLPAGASPYGVLDMGGNANEWMADCWHGDYDAAPPDAKAWTGDCESDDGNDGDYDRVVRDDTNTGRIAARGSAHVNTNSFLGLGFRCCADPGPAPVDECGGCGPEEECFDGKCYAKCGNAECDEGEDCSSCADDCYCSEYETCDAQRKGCVANMVELPSADFWMGCNGALEEWCMGEELPYHKVHLDAYAADVVEVTAGEYAACAKAGKCAAVVDVSCEDYWGTTTYGAPGMRNHPINCVSWSNARDYCEWAGKRLCTEAEWERAARGGCDVHEDCKSGGFMFPWGNGDPTSELAVGDSDGGECSFQGPQEVGKRPEGASPYGLMDMAGNVEEWVSDWYGPDYYCKGDDAETFDWYADDICDASDPPAPATGDNPSGPPSGVARVVRGGGFEDSSFFLRSWSRLWDVPDGAESDRGFRCCRTTGAN